MAAPRIKLHVPHVAWRVLHLAVSSATAASTENSEVSVTVKYVGVWLDVGDEIFVVWLVHFVAECACEAAQGHGSENHILPHRCRGYHLL